MAGKEKEKVLPDHLRCNRTDGRQWRCSRRVLDGKKLCEIHYLQGRHRQFKRKVPDSLKLERKNKKKNEKENNYDNSNRNNSLQIRASKSVKISKAPLEKRKRRLSEALDEALKKMRLKRGDLQLELVRVFLKRQVEKKKAKDLEIEKEIQNQNASKAQELEFPNALVAISQSPTEVIDNAGGSLDVKLGLGLERSSTAFYQRHFRSKNIEPTPISSMQVVPCVDMLRKKRKKCHWCRKDVYRRLIKCLNCRKHLFCVDCIKERFIEKQEIEVTCPVCREACNCRICTRGQIKTSNHKFQENFQEKKKVHKIQVLQYLIYNLLPILSQINQDQSTELGIEAKITGKADSEIQIQQAESNYRKLHCCSNCKVSILDYHRSCGNCSYNLCLSCCWEFCRGSSQGLFSSSCRRRTCSSDDEHPTKTKHINSRSGPRSSVSPMGLRNWEADADGSISCPPANFGGCGGSMLKLRCIYPLYWTKELEFSAEELLCKYNFPKSLNDSSCSLCNGIKDKAGGIKLLQEATNRVGSGLYHLSLQDLREENLEHFQKHWSKGHPVMIPNVLRSTSDLTWDPVNLFCAYLEMRSSASQNRNKAVKGTTCLDWCEVEFAAKKTFIGSLEGQMHANMQHKTIKFNAWLSSHLFQEHFPAHFAETLRSLPLREYMNPISGLLNLAVKLPREAPKPELGPCIFISYSGPEEFVQGESLTKLCCDSCDVVNILAHATDAPISKEQLGIIKKLMKKYKAQDGRHSTSDSTDQKEKSSVHSEETEESGLREISKEGLHLPDGIFKVPFYPGDSIKDQILSTEDGNTSHDSEYESESDSEVSILCSGTIEGSEDSDNVCIFQDDIESSSSSPEKQVAEKQVADSCGAQWDIFRRQDVPKLLEYLRRHSNEFSAAYCSSKHVVHPILDQSFFLDAFHKMRLKEEFDIQPWTFKQHPGEAIIIPAGCPYQIKKLKSCVNIVLDFISPENAKECISLTNEIRLLPVHHKARAKMLEVERMALNGISAAIEEIRDLMQMKVVDELKE